jgi:BlaI family transcriptional regulator, penicillinase repressor
MKIHQITDAELSILQILWDRGETTSRDLAESLYEEATDPKIATVQKLIERLEAKGCVRRDRTLRAHRFHPLLSREEYLRGRMQALADRLCDGALTPLMTTLLRSKGLSRKQRDLLRKMIEEQWPT